MQNVRFPPVLRRDRQCGIPSVSGATCAASARRNAGVLLFDIPFMARVAIEHDPTPRWSAPDATSDRGTFGAAGARNISRRLARMRSPARGRRGFARSRVTRWRDGLVARERHLILTHQADSVHLSAAIWKYARWLGAGSAALVNFCRDQMSGKCWIICSGSGLRCRISPP